jgi:hypothetical protein
MVVISKMNSKMTEDYLEATAFLSAAKYAAEHAESEARRAPGLRTHALHLAAEETLTIAYGEVGRARAKLQRAEGVSKQCKTI